MKEQDITREVWEEIFEGLYSYISSGQKSTKPFNKVHISEYHQIDVLNRGACGTYSDDEGNPLFDFEIRDGNNNGSEVIRVTEPDDLVPPKRYHKQYVFEPDDRIILPESMERAWMILRANKAIQEMQGKMAYDLTFDPSTKTRKHYEDYASRIKARIVCKAVEVN